MIRGLKCITARTQESVRSVGLLTLFLQAVLACSHQSSSNKVCSGVKSLLRFDVQNAAAAASALGENFFSNGGFIEVLTRAEPLGVIDKSRLCTAYVEFVDNPADVPQDLAARPLTMNVYTATHCLNFSTDQDIRLHLFNGSVYRDFWVDYKALEAVKTLRSEMRRKGVDEPTRKKILEAFRSSATNPDELFNAPIISSETVGTGGSKKALEICGKKDDPDWQHVCATYQDLTVLQVQPSPETPAVVLDELKALRTKSLERTTRWIGGTTIATRLAEATPPRLAFPDEPDNVLDLKSLHAAMRKRVSDFSKFKSVQFVGQELGADFRACLSAQSGSVCQVTNEVAAVFKAALEGTGYEKFEDAKLYYSLEAFKSGYANVQAKMDRAFEVFSPFYQSTNGTTSVALTGRVHSNFRFVPFAQSPVDKPDPKDSLSTGRAFAHIHVNNLTGDRTGASVNYIRWANSDGRFNYFKLPRKLTPEVIANYQNRPIAERMTPHVGFMQAGDSGSIIVLEHIPLFAITSVDGQGTSGGSGLRPLPQPIEENDVEDVKRATAGSKQGATACR